MYKTVVIDLSDEEGEPVANTPAAAKRVLLPEINTVNKQPKLEGTSGPGMVSPSKLSEEQLSRIAANKAAALERRRLATQQKSVQTAGQVAGEWRSTKRCLPPGWEASNAGTSGAGFFPERTPQPSNKTLPTEVPVLAKAATTSADLKAAKVVLSKQQLSVLNALDKGSSIFLTGSAGTGKSFLLNYAIRMLQVKHGAQAVFVTASTGIAAVNISGTTLHTFAGVGIAQEPAEVLVDKVLNRREAVTRWSAAKALIIDEISMIDGEFLDKVEYVARVVRRNQKPFGGIQLLIAGDFFQLPPVKLKTFAFEAKCWERCIQLQVELTHVFRQANEEFVKILNEVRLGHCPPSTQEVLRKCFKTVIPTDDGVMLTKLYPHKVDVRRENEENMRLIQGERVEFLARDSAMNSFTAKQLENFRAEKHLMLCAGAQVMLIKNINPSLGLANGARGVVTGFTDVKDDTAAEYRTLYPDISPTARWPVVKFACMSEPMVLGPEDESVMEGIRELCKRQQVPLVLAWALSVHKCQGMTLDRVETDLSKAFDYGMCYVALSRVKSLEGLRLLGFDPSRVKVHQKVVQFYEGFSKDQ